MKHDKKMNDMVKRFNIPSHTLAQVVDSTNDDELKAIIKRFTDKLHQLVIDANNQNN